MCFLYFLGNVALINLGISEEEYTYVCTDVDFIIHAAATVNLIYPYTVSEWADLDLNFWFLVQSIPVVYFHY